MAVDFYLYIIFYLLIINNTVHSQNDTNETLTTTSSAITTTLFHTTISPTQYPSLSPTTPTSAPTLSPTYEGCTAIHGYVQTTVNIIGMDGQINSYPVNYGPNKYRIFNKSIAVFPKPLGTELDPCDISLFNRNDIINKVVLIDATLYTIINCNYQQWTLNFQSLGAKALLIGANMFTNYNGETGLQNPRIPTRFIHYQSVSDITNKTCGSLITCDTKLIDIRITFDCNNNTAPELICIDDMDYGRDDYFRINGEYEQLGGNDINGHPIWQQDAIYNIDSSINWQIYFDIHTYFNWVIGEGPNNPPPKAYCNDTITDNPINCSIWYKIKKGPNDYERVNSINMIDGLCPMPDENGNTTNYCIRTESNDMNGYIGTYKQLINDIPEWFYEKQNDASVSILYWSEFNMGPLGDKCYGWQINNNGVKAYCCYKNNDVSVNNPQIRFKPYLCTQWLDSQQTIDNTFDIDANICEENIDSAIDMICIEYQETKNGDYSIWSGTYKLTINKTFVNNHRIWQWESDNNKIYYIIYYEVNDKWIITVDNYNIIDKSNIFAYCEDKKGIYDNPTSCMYWIVMNTSDIIEIDNINDRNECEVIIIRSITTTEKVSGEESGSKGKKGLAGFGYAEYIAIGAALLAFPICIVCFVCYTKRKTKKKNTDEGISLQPYVPTGMAYDSYKQNQSHQLAQQAAKEKKEREKRKDKKKKTSTLKAAAPRSVASASGLDDDQNGESQTVDSKNALINVFDEDDAPTQTEDNQAMASDTDNPFLRDDIIRTGQTIDETHQIIDTTDIMNAFDE